MKRWIDRYYRRLNMIRRKYVPGFHMLPHNRAFLPIDITLELTYDCNLKCPMCYQKVVQNHQFQKKNDDDNPSPEIYKKFLNQMRHHRPTIRITGGEPMLYPHYFELAEYAKRIGLEVITPTNGTLLADHAKKIVSLPLDTLIVTITGPNSTIHDKQVGVSGAFNMALTGIQEVLKERKKNGSKFPKLFINAVWSKDNQECMPEMVLLAQSLGVDSISFTHVWYWDPSLIEKQHRCYPQFGRLMPTSNVAYQGIDPDIVAASIREIKNMDIDIPVLFYPDLNEKQVDEYYSSSEKPVTQHICKVPWLATYIRPNGNVAPCYLNYSVGNIKNADFSEIWNGSGYRELRRALLISGPLPACYRCTGSFLFSLKQRGHSTLG